MIANVNQRGLALSRTYGAFVVNGVVCPCGTKTDNSKYGTSRGRNLLFCRESQSRTAHCGKGTQLPLLPQGVARKYNIHTCWKIKTVMITVLIVYKRGYCSGYFCIRNGYDNWQLYQTIFNIYIGHSILQEVKQVTCSFSELVWYYESWDRIGARPGGQSMCWRLMQIAPFTDISAASAVASPRTSAYYIVPARIGIDT